MEKLNYKKVLPYLFNRYKKDTHPIGDLCRDVLNDLYDEEMTSPEWVFNYIKDKCDNLCYINALEPLRAMYNKRVDNPLFKIYINKSKNDDFYGYKGHIIHRVGDGILEEMIKYMEESE